MDTSASPARSAAVLIGVSRYDHLEPLPGVQGNVTDLAAQLCDPSVWGLPADQCLVRLDPVSQSAALAPLQELEHRRLDTLIVYYAGHGLIDPNTGELWLGLPGSRTGAVETAVPYDWLRRKLLRLDVERRIVILDCCYSGRALGMMGDPPSAVANGAVVEGTYLIASAGESAQALAPPGARHTAFTGELIGILSRGVEYGPEVLPLDALFEYLTEALRARSCPQPQKRVRNTAGRLPLFRNRAYTPGRAQRVLADRYELGAVVRRDAVTETYQAHDTALDRQVDITLMTPRAAADPALSAGFRHRAKSRALLRHPSVAVLLDIGTEPRAGLPCPYLVTERTAGTPLRVFAQPRPAPVDWAVRVAAELLGVLTHAHQLGVHGWRLDADSVVLTPEGQIKVVDLGDAPDGRDDLLEVGRLLHTLLTGESPAGAPPSARRPEVSDELDAVVLRALAPHPAAPYRTARDMQLALEGLRDRAVRRNARPTAPVTPVRSAARTAEAAPFTLRYAAGSHRGLLHDRNQDSGYAGPRLLALADGGSGTPAGEVASSEVIAAIVNLDDDPPGTDLLAPLDEAVHRAHQQLRIMAEDGPGLLGMETTLTALLLAGRRLGLAHVGDSRAYLLRDGRLEQITADHTVVQRLVDEGRITPEQAFVHPQRGLLTHALGRAEAVEPDLSVREIRAGDRYLLCTDGLSSVVSHETVRSCLAAFDSPDATVQELLQLALRGGGPGNVSCVVADIVPANRDEIMGWTADVPVVIGAVAENQVDRR